MKAKVFTPAPWHQTNWDARAAGNFIGGGSGTGLVLFAALAAAAGMDYRAAVALGLALVALGLTCVWLEIGKPWRALHVFFHPQTSWMSREAMIAPVLFAAGLAALAFGGAWTWLAALFGMAFLYAQGRILQAAKGIPAWRQGRIVPLIVTTGLAEGAGWMLLLAAAGGLSLRAFAAAGFLLLLSRVVAWRSYLNQLAATGAPVKTLQVYGRFDKPFLFAGNLLPALLLATAALGGSPWFAALGGLIAALAGWALKYVIVTRAAYNQGFALPRLPIRGSGVPQPGTKPGWR